MSAEAKPAGAIVLSYTGIAMALHWLIAGLMLTTIPLGLYCANAKGVLADQLMNIHKVIGLVILVLTAARIAWRLTHRPPALPDTMSSALRIIARGTHIAFYIILLVMPLSGWWMTSAFPKRHAFGIPGVFDLPFLPVPVSMPAAVAAHGVHVILGWMTIGLIALHIAAALKHHFIEGDDILVRMLRTSR